MTEPAGNPLFYRVMILFPNWLGDAVMATGLLELLHRHRNLPDGRQLHLTLGIGRSWAPLFANDSRFDDLLTIDRKGRHAGIPGLFQLRNDLVEAHYDAILLGPPSLRVALAAFLARIPVRLGYSGDGRSPLLAPRMDRLPRGQIHYAQEMRELGLALLAQVGLKDPDVTKETGPPLPGCEAIAAACPPPSCPRWVLAPGATFGQAKTWPLGQALDFCRLALADQCRELVLLGDASASPFARDLALGLGLEASAGITGRPGLVDLTGHTTLPEVVALLKSAVAFVGNDSGLMHLSAALGVPTVGIFGSSNPDWTSPVGPITKFLTAEGFPCRPCYLRTCNQARFCLEAITGAQVMTAVKTLVAAGPTREGRST